MGLMQLWVAKFFFIIFGWFVIPPTLLFIFEQFEWFNKSVTRNNGYFVYILICVLTAIIWYNLYVIIFP